MHEDLRDFGETSAPIAPAIRQRPQQTRLSAFPAEQIPKRKKPGILRPFDLKSVEHTSVGEQLKIIHLSGPRISQIDALQRRLAQMPEREHCSPAILRDDAEFIRPPSRCRRLAAMSVRHGAFRSSCRALACAARLCECAAEECLQCFSHYKRFPSPTNESCVRMNPNVCSPAVVSRAEKSPESAHGFLRRSEVSRAK